MQMLRVQRAPLERASVDAQHVCIAEKR